MWDLRWVLLGLGALVLVGVYLWSRGIVSRDMLPTLPRRKVRTEPIIGEPAPAPPPQAPPAVAEPPSLVETVTEEEKARPPPDRIVALRLIPRGAELAAERAVNALRNAGLEHGRYAIFHRQLGTNREGFSVASLTEPGSFDLDRLANFAEETGTVLNRLWQFDRLRANSAQLTTLVELGHALVAQLAPEELLHAISAIVPNF